MSETTKSKIRKKNDNIAIWLIVLLIILAIVVFIFSFGKVKSKKLIKLPQEFRDSKEEAKRKHEYFKNIVSKQEALNKRLNKKFKISYALFRLLCIIAWCGILIFFHFIGWINNLGDILTYSEAGILILLVVHFLFFGTISNLEDTINTIKARIENYVYRKNLNLKNELAHNKRQLAALEKEIAK